MLRTFADKPARRMQCWGRNQYPLVKADKNASEMAFSSQSTQRSWHVAADGMALMVSSVALEHDIMVWMILGKGSSQHLFSAAPLQDTCRFSLKFHLKIWNLVIWNDNAALKENKNIELAGCGHTENSSRCYCGQQIRKYSAGYWKMILKRSKFLKIIKWLKCALLMKGDHNIIVMQSKEWKSVAVLNESIHVKQSAKNTYYTKCGLTQ